jgi:hypothetical protein
MNAIKRILSLIKAGGVFLATLVGVLASTDKPEANDRPQGDGSDLFGEHNFRTGQADSGHAVQILNNHIFLLINCEL